MKIILASLLLAVGCSNTFIDLTPPDASDDADSEATDTGQDDSEPDSQDSSELDDAPPLPDDSPDAPEDAAPEDSDADESDEAEAESEAEDDAGASDDYTDPPDVEPDVEEDGVGETEDGTVEDAPEDLTDFTETPDTPDETSEEGTDSEPEDSGTEDIEPEDATEPDEAPTDPRVFVCTSWDGGGTSIEPFVAADWLWTGTRDPQRGVGQVQVTDKSALFRSGRDDWIHTSTSLTVTIPGGGTGPRQAWYVGGVWFFQQGSSRYVNDTATGITWSPGVEAVVEDETDCDPVSRVGWREGRVDGVTVYRQEWSPCEYTAMDGITVNQGYAARLDSTLPAYTPVRPLVTGPVVVLDFCFIGTPR